MVTNGVETYLFVNVSISDRICIRFQLENMFADFKDFIHKKEEFEDTKGVVRIHKSKRDRQTTQWPKVGLPSRGYDVNRNYPISWVPCCDVRYDFRMEALFGSSLPLAVCGGHVSYLRVFMWWCLTRSVFCVCFVFLRLMSPVSLDCPFVIAPSVFSDVY
jgi:hypothetical protein